MQLINKTQLSTNIVSLAVHIVLGIILFFSYKTPILTPDSEGYIDMANMPFRVCMRPNGYGLFLNLIGSSLGGRSVFFIQYLLFYISNTVFINTITRLAPNSKKVYQIIFATLIITIPPTLILTTYLMSDSLFYSLTLLWISVGIMYLLNNNKLKPVYAITHILILGLLLATRGVGLIYSIISISIFIIVRTKLLYKIIFVIIAFIYIIMINSLIDLNIEKKLGIDQTSGFSGWQLANNALCIYSEINPERIKNQDVLETHKWISTLMDSCTIKTKSPSTVYLWNPNSPLRLKYNQTISLQNRKFPTQAWYQVSDEYEKYGKTIIFTHPYKYLRYFVMPNYKNYVNPKFSLLASNWKYKNSVIKKFSTRYNIEPSIITRNLKKFETYFKKYFNIYHLSISLLGLIGFLISLIYSVKRKDTILLKAIYILFALYIIYIGAILALTPINVRLISITYFIPITYLYISTSVVKKL